MDFKHGKTYEYQEDCTNKGTLKHANMIHIEKFQFPDSFVPQGDLLYALTVKGDSMIDFGIPDESVVIVKSQNTAENGDIIVGGSKAENQLTLKKFEDTKSEVVLHPGNVKYEDIHISYQDFFINGVVMGVIIKG